jgi:hypothetical protein
LNGSWLRQAASIRSRTRAPEYRRASSNSWPLFEFFSRRRVSSFWIGVGATLGSDEV